MGVFVYMAWALANAQKIAHNILSHQKPLTAPLKMAHSGMCNDVP